MKQPQAILVVICACVYEQPSLSMHCQWQQMQKDTMKVTPMLPVTYFCGPFAKLADC
jgi:hypothetical protein